MAKVKFESFIMNFHLLFFWYNHVEISAF